MFSNGSVKFMGVCFALASLLTGWLGVALRSDSDKLWIVMFVFAAIFAVIAAACLVEAGRAITGRITAAIAFLICAAIFVAGLNAAFRGEKIEIEVGDHVVGVRWQAFGRAFFFAIMALGAGYYTIHGRFPENWTFEELFSWPSFVSTKKKSKSAKRTKTKRRVRSVED